VPLKLDSNINLASVAVSLGTNTHDLSIFGLSAASLIWITALADFNLTGLSGGEDGRVMFIGLRGAFTITIQAENVGSAASNRFAQAAILSAVTTGSIVTSWVYFGSRWRRWK
jgi:Tfp pilus assembly protein PilO